jgi:hypothetical protein
MFGFGKNKSPAKKTMPDDPVAYTMLAVANMTNLDPTKLTDNLRDTVLKHTLVACKIVDNKYDFCAHYMYYFSLVLYELAKAQNDAGWKEKSDRVLAAMGNFIEIEKANISKSTYNKLKDFFDKCQ